MSDIYANLSILLARLPATANDLSDELGVRRVTVGRWLRELCSAGMVLRGTYVQRAGRVWQRADAQPVQRLGWTYESKGLRRFIRAWQALQRRQTTDSLADMLSVTRRCASDIVQHMRGAGLVRVAAWEVRRQTVTPVYDRLVEARDVPRPQRMPRQVSNAAYWERRRLCIVGVPADEQRAAP